MEINIITDKVNAALKRRDVSISVKSESTPSRVEVKNKLAAMLDSKPELIVVDKLNTVFGRQETVGTVGIYEDEEHLKNVALGHLVGRDKVPEEPEVEAAPESEGKTEAPEGEAAPAAEEDAPAEPEPEAAAEEKSAEESKPEASEESD